MNSSQTIMASSDDIDFTTMFEEWCHDDIDHLEVKPIQPPDAVTPYVLPEHHAIWSTGEYCHIERRFNPIAYEMFKETNKIVDGLYPLECERFDKSGLSSTMTLPVKIPSDYSALGQDIFIGLVSDYSHDIMLMILRRDTVETIDGFIKTLEQYAKTTPPFRFRFFDVVLVFTREGTSSKFLHI